MIHSASRSAHAENKIPTFLSQGDPSLYTNLADNSLRLGDFKTALEAATYAHELDPNDLDTYLVRATILIDENRMQDAADVLVEAVIIIRDSDQRFLAPLQKLYETGVDLRDVQWLTA